MKVVLAIFVVELVSILIAACVRRVRYQRQVKLRRELQRRRLMSEAVYQLALYRELVTTFAGVGNGQGNGSGFFSKN